MIMITKMKTRLLFAFLLAICISYVFFAWAQMERIDAKWVVDISVSGDEKTAVIQLVEELSDKYLLSKECTDSPGKIADREVYFCDYKNEGEVAMTLHDLKDGGDKLTAYFYGAIDPKYDNLEVELEEILNRYK